MLLILLKLTTLLTIVFSLCLGVYTLIRNRKLLVHWLWFFTCLSITVWGVGYLLTASGGDATSAINYVKIVYFGGTFLPIFFFHFLNKFLMKDYKMVLIIGYILAGIFLILFFFTSSLIKGIGYSKSFGFYEQVNFPLFYFYLLYFLFFVIYCFIFLLRAYRYSGGIKKKQILFIIWAGILGFGGGITYFFPQLFNIYPFGTFVVFLYPILITYGIFLPEVKVRM